MEVNDIIAVRISLASPEQIRSWSYGEVTKPETINYRTLKPERDGLFCERIFGPIKDWECACGKYKKVKYKGIICDRCGVEVAPSKVRRERMGHIELAAPVAHIWYVRGIPSRLGLLLDLSPRNLERVIYFAQYIVTEVDEEARARALNRLEKERLARLAKIDAEINAQIEEIDRRLKRELEEINRKIKAQIQELEEHLYSMSDEIAEQGRALQERLEALMGLPSPETIRIPWSDEVLLEEGEVVSREHLTRLNRAAQERLSLLEEGIRRRQEDLKLQAEAEKEFLSRKAEGEKDAVKARYEDTIFEIIDKYEQEMAELRSLQVTQVLSEARYQELREKWGAVFKAGMGAEALYEILKNLDLDKMARELRHEINTTRSAQRRKKAIRRLQIVEALRKSGNRPEWMILVMLPVIPPELRPMVPLDGGRFATSDLNDLYRRVINRNNRLKKLKELGAPEIIIRNEKRMLQEAVDALIDSGRRQPTGLVGAGKRGLRSLSDILRGKQGRFRRNLLGKRVDYSGRSVIVVGPELKLHQCGLPRDMALELFKPFVIRKLIEENHAHNIKSAKRMIERRDPAVWDVLESVVKERPVLLNRAPTLHRLGIQAFEVVLVDGQAIRIHPLVCPAFNADFDGDQMAVHVPLSDEAVREARELMLSSVNLLKPASGEPIVGPTKDMVLGCYYLTLMEEGVKGEGKIFADFDEVILAYETGVVDLHAKIKVLAKPSPDQAPQLIETTPGRVIFNVALPEELRFQNKVMDKKALNDLVAECYRKLGMHATAQVVDALKDLGFKYATRSGITLAMSDIKIPREKDEIVRRTEAQVEEINRQYRRGVITEEEQYMKSVELWTRATEEVSMAVAKELNPYESVGAMATSGATKGGIQTIRQLAGMRGLMADPSGRIIPLPIRSNFWEGLTTLEYFLSTHGARKGLADTALRTADAGYLTRRLVDVAQEVIVREYDCGTFDGIWIDVESSRRMGQSFAERVIGRTAAADIVDPATGRFIVRRNEEIDEEAFEKIKKAGIDKVYVRTPLKCETRYGVCALCYGRDMGRGGLIRVGEAVGIIAAQSIGEPGTQLTLRTFHTGGVAIEDITQGLPRVEELFEARTPKGEAIISDISGVVDIYWEGEIRKVKVTSTQVIADEYFIPVGSEIKVKDGQEIEEGTVLALTPDDGTITARIGGQIFLENNGDGSYKATIRKEHREERIYDVPPAARLRVEKGDYIEAGEQITEGAKNPKEIMRILGREAAQLYLLEEIQKVYRSQGVNIHDKHIEIIIRQMTDKVRVKSPGDTDYLPGQLVNRFEFEETNSRIIAQGGRPAEAVPVLLGITKAALATDSFFAAASFQETTRVLTDAAIRGAIDELRGLKENVIIGRLIPAGTGFEHYRRLREAALNREKT
ncbi:MAG: DNA-directed RNA polymerase subunit beta' [Anaerolineae bacterium]|nr:DNA-directed RNA polymerase subunit beta' [Anaerolineae bacterium]